MSNAQKKSPPSRGTKPPHLPKSKGKSIAQPAPGDEQNVEPNPAPEIALKRPRGAPKKTAHEKRSKVFQIRLTQSEYLALVKYASASKLSASDYARYATLRIPPPPKSSKANPVESSTLHALHRIARELAPIGNNLNQIAHAANIGRTLSGKLTQSVTELQRQLNEARRLLAVVAQNYDR